MRTAFILCCTLLACEAIAATGDREALIAGNTAFAVDLYGRLARNERGNIFVSPYSISAAMAMLNAGARGETALEIEKAMHFPLRGSQLTSAWSSVFADAGKKGAGIDLVTANALWAAKGVKFREEYLKAARSQFGARLETLDFAQAEAARARINAWVSETTRRKIQELVPAGSVNGSTRIVLTNAIYLKGDWATPFPERSVTKGVFHAPGGDVKASLMRQIDRFRYARVAGVRALELPYAGGEFSMLVLLPDANDGLGALEGSLTAKSLATWDSRLKPALVDVTLPEFSAEMSLELTQTLAAMGVRRALSAEADLSGIAAEPLMVSRVIHKARVDVDEKGTEAAAATAIIGVTMAAPPREPPPRPEVFKADHPFFYVIRRNGGSVLFVGRLVNPAS